MIDMPPLRLQHRQVLLGFAVGVVKVRDRALEEVGDGREVGVDDGDKLRVGQLARVLQRARLVPPAMRSADDLALQPRPVGERFSNRLVGDGDSFQVGRVVEDLYLQGVGGPREGRSHRHRALRHRRLVVHRQLHAHFWADGGQDAGRPRLPRLGAQQDHSQPLDEPADEEADDEEPGAVRAEEVGPRVPYTRVGLGVMPLEGVRHVRRVKRRV
mmetsp:Transcript_16166/g.36976  ORF Transcript_16166/g.36976 Transcript_16166/m.36976 type:complete len:214 (+) Transcript_16166:1491-2132(+)